MDLDLRPGARFAGWELRRLLGRGGMGEVWLSEDPALGRPVALKLLTLPGDPRLRARFSREIQAAAALSHPRLVRVFAAGEEAGVPWVAMEHLPGGSLADLVQRAGGRLPWRRAVELGVAMAEGLAAIHAAGLVHRDLKPPNVLLDEQGQPRIVDFGLVGLVARADGDAPRLTATGELLGTPEYLAPEQADGGPVDARADLYALGCTLFALCAGAPPFQGSLVELVNRHLTREPPGLRSLVPDAPPALEALVRRLLEKDPARRGAGAGAVAVELRRLLAGDPPRRRASRKPALAAATGGALLLAAAVLLRPAPTPTAPQPATPASSVATRAPAAPAAPPAQEPAPLADGRLRLARARGGPAWKLAGETFAVVFLDEDRLVALDEGGWLRWLELPSGRLLRLVRAHQGAGTRLALAPGRLFSAGREGPEPASLAAWDPETGALLGRVALEPGQEPIPEGDLVAAPDGSRLALIERGAGTWQVWVRDCRSLAPVGPGPLQGAGARPNALRFLPGGRLLVADGRIGLVVCDPEGLAPPTVLGAGTGASALDLDPRGLVALTSCVEDGRPGSTLRLHRLGEGLGECSLVAEVPAYPGAQVLALALLDGGRRALTSSIQAQEPVPLRAWDLSRRAPAWAPVAASQGGPRGHGWSLAVSPSGARVAAAVSDGVWAWEAASGRDLRRRGAGHALRVTGLHPLREGGLLSVGHEGRLLRWDPGREEPAEVPLLPPGEPGRDLLPAPSPGPDGALLLGRHGRLLSFDPTGRRTFELSLSPPRWVVAAALHPARGWLLADEQGRCVEVAGEGSPEVQLLRGGSGLRALRLAWLPDGRRLCARSDGAWVFDPQGPDHEQVVAEPAPWLAASLLPDGRSLLVGDSRGGLGLMSLEARVLSRLPVPRHAAPITAVAVDARGELGLSAARDGSLSLWRLTPGSEDQPLTRLGGLDLSPGGDWATCAAFGEPGRAWLGTERGRVLELELTAD